jgi:DeoR/GlpR family transcriptional regulator of sugar metabolism
MIDANAGGEDMPRFAEERRARILKALREHGRMEVLALARMFDVSGHTIRRDLKQLHEQGELQKTHGGAVMLDSARLGFDARAALMQRNKDAIGRAAASLIEPGCTVILDAGSTALALARALTVRPITVITNSLDVALALDRDPALQLVLTGGTWQPQARALRGAATRELLATCRADIAVLGACALDVQAGVTVSDEEDAAVKRAMLARAARAIVLADRSKQHGIAAFQVASWSQVHTLVTDVSWPEVAQLGVHIHEVS